MLPCRSASRSPEDYRASLDILRAEAKRLKHIVEDLFTLARADAGQYPLTLTDFYLDELVTECTAERANAGRCQANHALLRHLERDAHSRR